MMQADWVKDLISVVEGIDISDLPAVLPILGSVNGAVFITPSWDAEGTRDSQEVQAPEEPKAPSIYCPINFDVLFWACIY